MDLKVLEKNIEVVDKNYNEIKLMSEGLLELIKKANLIYSNHYNPKPNKIAKKTLIEFNEKTSELQRFLQKLKLFSLKKQQETDEARCLGALVVNYSRFEGSAKILVLVEKNYDIEEYLNDGIYKSVHINNQSIKENIHYQELFDMVSAVRNLIVHNAYHLIKLYGNHFPHNAFCNLIQNWIYIFRFCFLSNISYFNLGWRQKLEEMQKNQQ